MTRIEDLVLQAAVDLEDASDGDAALALAEATVDELVRMVEEEDFLTVWEGLRRVAVREPQAVATIATQALVEISVVPRIRP